MKPLAHRPYAVILAGGGGTRLWPLSTPARPKPFVPLADGRTLLAATLDRLTPLVPIDDCYVVCAAAHVELVRESLPALDPSHILAEPRGRNTGPAVAFAATHIERPADAPMLVLPADHAVRDAAAWRAAVSSALSIAAAEGSSLVTLGVVPTSAATGFGYIVAIGPRVERFVEKPDATTAARLVKEGARWNAGTFVWRRGAILTALRAYAPATLAGIDDYEQITPGPIDTLVMEPAAAAGHVRTVPLDCGWSDVGSWRSLRSHLLEAGACDASGVITIATRDGGSVMINPDGRVSARGSIGEFTIDPERMSDAEIRAAAAEHANR
ncbi:MAG: mannose-1-phosphate guanylyltransferase [Candidatus Limnocylindrus sp.]|jgi:mannose-1-phosphate guanylyltransferase